MRTSIRSLALLFLVVALGAAMPAAAQNPFLQNRGKRTIDRIEFVGNTVTHEYVLRRELGFREGDEYDSEAIGEAWERLESLDFIAYVDIETERPDPTSIELVIRVEEDTRFQWAPDLEYSRRHGDGFSASLRFGTTNLRGRAESLDLTVMGWAHRGARLTWQNPWILGDARLGVLASANWEQHDWEYETGPIGPGTDFSDWGFDLGLWRAFDPWVTVTARGRWRELEASDLLAQDPTLTFGLVHDSRDTPFYPSRGAVARTELQLGGFTDDTADYAIGTFSISGFAKIPFVDSIFATHGAYRVTNEALPYWERTYLGGPMNVRGIDFGTVPGDEAWRASVELRRPLLLLPLREGRTIGLGVHVFHDWGAAWDQDFEPSDAATRYAFGAGVHFNLNTRNFRFEWARTDGDEDVFVFEDTFSF